MSTLKNFSSLSSPSNLSSIASSISASIPSSADFICICLNVMFFITVQTLFFKYIGSTQYEKLIEKKLDWMKLLARKNPDFKASLKSIRDTYSEKYKVTQEQMRIEREKENKKLEWQYSWVWVLILGIATVVFTAITFYRKSWTQVDTLTLICVIFAYITELIFFFAIFKQYELVGDNYIIGGFLQHQIHHIKDKHHC